MASKKRKIKNVRELRLAGAAIALVVEVDGDCFGVVCVEVTALFLGQGVAGDHWHMLVLILQQKSLGKVTFKGLLNVDGLLGTSLEVWDTTLGLAECHSTFR
jgi:hypothetical protein